MKSDKIYILHMIDSMDQISEYTDQITRGEFQENRLIQDAVVRNFEIIGEAAKHISDRCNWPIWFTHRAGKKYAHFP